MIIEKLSHGYSICADSTNEETVDVIRDLLKDETLPLILADPPYGNVLSDKWDVVGCSDSSFAEWMVSWTISWKKILVEGGAFYVWGGTGRPGFRPFFKYITAVERESEFELANLITWKKKRGYGVQNNYLYTREELAYFVNGEAKKPAKFNVPYLEEVRGYAGFNKKYPAKDSRYRRTNVWTDVTEIMQGKRHVAQKKQRLLEIPIEVHTSPRDWVLDPFSASGSTAEACMKLGRRFIIIEKDLQTYESTLKHLKKIT